MSDSSKWHDLFVYFVIFVTYYQQLHYKFVYILCSTFRIWYSFFKSHYFMLYYVLMYKFFCVRIISTVDCNSSLYVICVCLGVSMYIFCELVMQFALPPLRLLLKPSSRVFRQIRSRLLSTMAVCLLWQPLLLRTPEVMDFCSTARSIERAGKERNLTCLANCTDRTSNKLDFV